MTIDGQATRTDSEESPGRGQHSRKEYADRAVSFAENLMKQLDLNEQSDRKAVQSLLLSALKIEKRMDGSNCNSRLNIRMAAN